MSEKEKNEGTVESSEPTLEIEDLDATDAADVKGGVPPHKPIEIDSW
jgi:hypothetical protein